MCSNRTAGPCNKQNCSYFISTALVILVRSLICDMSNNRAVRPRNKQNCGPSMLVRTLICDALLFIKGRGATCVHPRDELVTIEHILLFCFDLTEAVFPSSVTEDVVRGRIFGLHL